MTIIPKRITLRLPDDLRMRIQRLSESEHWFHLSKFVNGSIRRNLDRIEAEWAANEKLHAAAELARSAGKSDKASQRVHTKSTRKKPFMNGRQKKGA